jgi:hypothetical protein
VREAKKVERFRLSLSAHLTLLGRMAAEADQPGLVWVQSQFECTHPLV